MFSNLLGSRGLSKFHISVCAAALMGIVSVDQSIAQPPDILCIGSDHGGGSVSVAVTPDGLSVASSGGGDRVLRLMNSDDCAVDDRLDSVGLADLVGFSPDGQIVATASYDLLLKLADAQTGELLRATPPHSDNLNALAFSPGGQLIASIDGGENVVKLWRTNDVALLTTIVPQSGQGPIPAVAFSPDGGILAVSLTPACPSCPTTIDLWDRLSETTWSLAGTLMGHSGAALALAFTPDGQMLLSGGPGGAIHAWRVADGAMIGTFTGHSGEVRSIAISPDGRNLVSGGMDATIRFWRLPAGHPLRTDDEQTGPFVSSVTFAPNGARFVYGRGDGAVVVAANPYCLAGDMNGDGEVSLNDLTILLSQFGQCASDVGFLAAADIDGRGCVDLPDLTVLLSQFGQSCP